MNSSNYFRNQRTSWSWATLLGVSVAAATASAADTTSTNTPPASAPALTPGQWFEGGTNAYNNWVDFSAGGIFAGGNQSQFQYRHQSPTGAFGGIEDLHYGGNLAKDTTLTLDGHSIFGDKDYALSLGVVKEKTGYLRFSISQFREWYNGDGGFYQPTGTYYPLSEDALGLDRGEIAFEGGLTLENQPKVIFKYAHQWREGEKGSTSWGFVQPPDGGLARGLYPSFYNINEYSDSFQVDVTHKIKATDFGVGMRYDFGTLDDTRQMTQFPGQSSTPFVSNHEGTSYDLFNVHAFSETWIKKNLMLGVAASYSDLDNTLSGERTYGTAFGIPSVPSAGQGDFGYIGLNGGSRLQETVADVNLFYKPWDYFTVVPSVRVLREDTVGDTSALETIGISPSVGPLFANSDYGTTDVRERLDLRYTAVTNWVFWARGEVTEGQGNLKEAGGLVPIGGFGVPPIDRNTDDSRLFQKYSLGARWYPLRRVTIDAEGYYRLNQYDYDHLVDSTPNFASALAATGNGYPAFLTTQDLDTWDGNLRLTLKPRDNVTLVSRYEYQWSTIDTTPDPVSGLSEVESSTIQSHILGQDIGWSPWSRLALQVGFNYVLSDTRTPASEFTQAILNSQNNYWTLNFSSTFVVNDLTDLNLGYFYYRADNFENNSPAGVPLDAGAEEHGVTAGVVRRISKNMRLSLKYGYFHYNDETYGGNQNFDAHMVYSSLRYRF